MLYLGITSETVVQMFLSFFLILLTVVKYISRMFIYLTRTDNNISYITICIAFYIIKLVVISLVNLLFLPCQQIGRALMCP